MAPRRVVKTINNTKLTIKDVICPICRSILIEPITLPCQHNFCTSCFHLTTITSDTRNYDRANLLCPLCCIRIGSWLRTASKSKKLINQQLWHTIQQQFPSQVQTKLKTVHQNYKKHCIQQQQDFQINSTKAKRNLMDLNDNNNDNNNNHNNKKKNSEITTKEYTCRILCEKIQTNLDDSNRINRSNSIESECLYFKPIDYRHNPPSSLLSTTITSENQQPIKVPTQRPTLNNRNIKIIAPCGQNRLNLDPIQSAFAYYFLFTTGSNNSNNTINNNKNKAVKRGNKKKLRIDNHDGNNMVAAIKMRRNLRSNSRHCLELQKQKRLEQERSDFELAIKLQEAYNQYKYKTRSCTVTTTTT